VVEVLEVRGQSVWLESPEDLGESVGSARLRSNPWYLLDALRSRIDELRGEDGEKQPSPAGLRIVAALLGLSGPGAGGKSVSSFGIHATLYSDGTATGHVDCVDQMGDTAVGNIFGEVTRWSMGPYGLTLFVTGKLVNIPGGHPVAANFPVTIQRFGGAGVGHWTLGNPASPFCIELLISGQLVERLN